MSKTPLYSKAETQAFVDNEYLLADEVRDMVFKVGKQVGMSEYLSGLMSNAAARAMIEAMPVAPAELSKDPLRPLAGIKLPAAGAVVRIITLLFQALAEGRGLEAAEAFGQVLYPAKLVHASGQAQNPGVLRIMEGAA